MLSTVYGLETQLLRIRRRKQKLEDSLRKAKADLRAARISQVEYDGSLRSFLDRFSGKKADKEEALSRDVRKAEAELSALERRIEEETAKLSSLQEQRSIFPPADTLRTAENEDQWATLELAFCAEALLPLLEDTAVALEEYRQMLRGEFPMLSVDRQQQIGAAPIASAEECLPLLKRLETAGALLNKPMPVPEFFRNPAGFLAAAARHNQLERAVNAQAQTERLIKHLPQLPEAE